MIVALIRRKGKKNMLKLVNTFFVVAGVMSISFGIMAASTTMDYFEILAVSSMVGVTVGLFNVLEK